MTVTRDIHNLLKATAFDNAGEKLGKVEELFVNDASGQPDFVEVSHGLFGRKSSLVPLKGHDFDGEELKLAFSKDRIEDAPEFDETHLTSDIQASLYAHYGVANAQDHVTYGGAEVEQRHAAAEVDEQAAAERRAANAQADAKVDANADELILSEERLSVDKTRQEAGQVRLRKYVDTKVETFEVPVEREEAVIERTPISTEEAANYDNTISEAEASVTLHEDRVDVTKKAVPVEKVSLGKKVVEDSHTVSEEVAKEHLATEGVEEGTLER